MRSMFGPLALAVAASLPVVIFVGCGVGTSPQVNPDVSSGAADVTVSTSQALTDVPIALVRVTVKGPDMGDVVQSLTQAGSTWAGTLFRLPAGDERSFIAEAFDAGGKVLYKGQVEKVRIEAGKTVAVAIVLQEAAPPAPFQNSAPRILSLSASNTNVGPRETIQVRVEAMDPDGDPVRIQWTAPAGAFADASKDETTWTAPESVTSVPLVVRVSDPRGASVTMSVTIQVSAIGGAHVIASFNSWPEVRSISVAPSARLQPGQAVRVSANVLDRDGDALTYNWTHDCSSGRFDDARLASPIFTLDAVDPRGACTLTLQVEDARQGRGRGSLSVETAAQPTGGQPPVVETQYQSILEAVGGEAVQLRFGASDPEGTALSVSWVASAGTFETTKSLGSGQYGATWRAPAVFSAIAMVQAIVRDAGGQTTLVTYFVAPDARDCDPGDSTQTPAIPPASECVSSTQRRACSSIGRWQAAEYCGDQGVCAVGACVAPPATNLALWLRGDQGVEVDPGGSVSRWRDQSGLGNDAIPLVGPSPVVEGGALAGYPVVSFPGSSSLQVAHHSSLDPGSSQSFTVGVVVRAAAPSSPSYNGFVGLINKSSSGVIKGWQLFTHNGAGRVSAEVGSVATVTPGETLDSRVPLRADAFQMVFATFDRAASRVRFHVNGSFQGDIAAPGLATDLSTPDPLRIGVERAQEEFMTGAIAEVLYYGTALPDPYRKDAEQYFSKKYGLGVAPDTCGAGESACWANGAAYCASLSTDANNCGVCGRSCLGGACTGGACQPVVLASGISGPLGIAVDANRVYVTAETSGSVHSVPKVGGAVVTLATGTPVAHGITTDGNSVYWANLVHNGGIRSIPATGGPVSVISPGLSFPAWPVLFGGDVYWANNGAGTVVRAPIGGGATEVLVSGQKFPGWVATDGTTLFWTNNTSPDGGVYKTPLSGGPVVPIVEGVSSPHRIVLDSKFAYWVEWGTGRVSRVSKAGGTRQVLATGPVGAAGLVIDRSFAYWTNRETGVVARTPKWGGPTEVVASGQGTVTDIAEDAAFVYWNSLNKGQVMRIAK